MWDACKLVWSLLVGLFRSRASLETENLDPRQQIIVLRRTAPKRLRFNVLDWLIFVGLYQLLPDVRHALAVIKPETVIRWHRAGVQSLLALAIGEPPFTGARQHQKSILSGLYCKKNSNCAHDGLDRPWRKCVFLSMA